MFQDNNIANRRVAKNTIFLSIRMLIVLCINLYATRVVLSTLGVEDYGIYNVVCGFVSLFAFLNSSLSNGIQRFYNYELGKNGDSGLDKIYTSALIIQIIVILIVILLTETVGLWYLDNKMVIPYDRLLTARSIYQLSILSFVLVILQSPFSAAVLAFERMDYYAVVSVVITILKLIAALLLPCFVVDRLLLYSVFLVIISIIEFLLYYVYVKISFKTIKCNVLVDSSLFKSMCVFSGWNIFGTFSGIMKEQGVNLVLNFFCGPVVNAARAIANQVSGGLQSFVSNLTIPVRPQVIKSYAAGDIIRTMSLTFTISKLSCYFIYILALPIIAEIDFILKIWLGSNIPDFTSSFVIIIILTSFLSNLNAAVSGVVHASGKMKLYQISTSLAGLLSVPLSYLVLRFYGNPQLALLMVFVAMLLVQVVSLYILKRIVPFSMFQYLKEVIFPLIIVIGTTWFIPLLIDCLSLVELANFVVTAIASIFAVSFSIYMFGLSQSEKLILKQLIYKVLKKC